MPVKPTSRHKSRASGPMAPLHATVLVSALAGLLLSCNNSGQEHRQSDGSWPQQWVEEMSDSTAQSLSAQFGRPCPTELAEANAGNIDSLCRGIVPRSGKIWFELPDDGQPCWCACKALQNFGPLTIDSLRVIRQQLERTLARKRLGSPEHRIAGEGQWSKDTARKEVHSGDTLKHERDQRSTLTERAKRKCAAKVPIDVAPPPPLPPPGSAVVVMHARTSLPMPFDCPWADWEFPFGDGYVRVCDLVEQVWRAYPYFKVETQRAEDWPYVVRAPEFRDDISHGRVITDDKLMTIVVPDGFMEAPEVLGEMLVWMLLHEVGHALGPVDACDEGIWVSTEGAADYWGAAVGLRELYEDGDEFIRVSKAAQEQLEQYALSVYRGDLSVHGDFTCDCPLNRSVNHPPVTCRIRTIQMARWADSRRAPCSRNWCDELEDCPSCPIP